MSSATVAIAAAAVAVALAVWRSSRRLARSKAGSSAAAPTLARRSQFILGIQTIVLLAALTGFAVILRTILADR